MPTEHMNKKIYYTRLDFAPCILPHEAQTKSQFAFSVVNGIKAGRITRGTDKDRRVYYENELYNFIRTHPNSPMNQRIRRTLEILLEWNN
jgi:hypothetical protein